jgi:CO/xanthine dehydrogenase FAD-binding subunit
MIVEYHRPKTLREALTLLAREAPISYPMGGGTVLNQESSNEYAVVDLQALDLGTIAAKGNFLLIGATVTLQQLCKFKGLAAEVIKAIELEATYNIRQMATIAGKLVTAGGRSSLLTALLAMDAAIEVQILGEKTKTIKIGEWLPLRNQSGIKGLITSVSIPTNTKFAYEAIARTPADLPIVCAAISQWNSGRTRLALGGWGKVPIIAMDGPEADGIQAASKNAYSTAQDQWASAEYRQEMAGVLSGRLLQNIQQHN